MVSKEEIEMFIQEAEGHIKKSEIEILKFEDNLRDKKPIEQLYYSFQALKALAPMVGLNNLSKYCNHLESLLEKVKDGETKIKKTNQLINLIFDSLEILNSVVKKVKKGEIQDIEDGFLENQGELLDKFDSEYEITFIKPLDLTQIDSIINDKKNIFYNIQIKISETCKFKKVRLFIIFRALNKVGQICWSNPEPILLENAEFEFEFDVFFISHNNSSEINEILEEILEIENKGIKAIDPNEFKRIITNYTLKWQKAMEKMIKLKESSQEIEGKYDIPFIYPISLEEYEILMSEKQNIFYYIYIRIGLSCKNKKTRVYFILKALNNDGHICWSNPEPNLLEKGEFNVDFELYYISKKRSSEIRPELDKISEIIRIVIKEIKPHKFKSIVKKSRLKEQIQPKELKEIQKEPDKQEISSPKIIITESIDSMQKINLPNDQIIKMIHNDNLNTIFSCKKSSNPEQFYIYIVKEGLCFVAKDDDYKLFEDLYNIHEKGFTDFNHFLSSIMNS